MKKRIYWPGWFTQKNASYVMSVNKDLSIALYKSISDANEERIYKAWHASSLAICPRAHYFKRLGVPTLERNLPSAAKMLRWNTGHLAETAIRPHIVNVWGDGESVESNQRLTSKVLDLTGEFDNHAVANKTLIEIKTVHDYAFIERNGIATLKQATGKLNKWGKNEMEPMLTPYLHHEIQNHAYVLLCKEKNIEIDKIDYVYITLSGRIVVYSTLVSDKLLERVLTRLELLNKAWKLQEPPECLCSEDSPLYGGVYQWCEYKTDKNCCSLNLIKVKEKVNG